MKSCVLLNLGRVVEAVGQQASRGHQTRPGTCHLNHSRRPAVALVRLAALLALGLPGGGLPARGADLPWPEGQEYGVHKVRSAHQVGAHDAFPLGQDYIFSGGVSVTPPRTLREGWLTPPGRSRVALDPESGPWEFGGQEDFDSEAALHEAFPAGNYQFSLTFSDSSSGAAMLNLPADCFPARPQIVNLPALQSIRVDANNVVRWQSLGNGPEPDTIGLSILGVPSGFESGSLPGTAREVTVPANTLGSTLMFNSAGQPCYLGVLTFLRVTDRDTTSIPGLNGGAAGVSQVLFWVVAGDNPPPPEPPVIHELIIDPDGSVGNIKLSLGAGQSYQVQVSSDLSAWGIAAEGQASTEPVTVNLELDRSWSSGFFRVVVLP